jgi:hypothetical protein
LTGLTSLITRVPPMPPKLNRRRAMFMLTKIDEILAWERQKDCERYLNHILSASADCGKLGA